jgi:ABC-type sugar transport system ATPase subunit
MSDVASDAPVLETHGISKRFGGVHALERVNFTLRAGEVVALAGDNGAGKSTFTKIISGVFQPSEGEIRYRGRKVSFDGPQAARTQGIETIYQDLALADNLDIGGNVFLGRESTVAACGRKRQKPSPFSTCISIGWTARFARCQVVSARLSRSVEQSTGTRVC